MLGCASPLYPSDYHLRAIYILTSATEDEAHVPERAVAGRTEWIDCFGKAQLAGSVFTGGVNSPGEIDGHPSLKRLIRCATQSNKPTI